MHALKLIVFDWDGTLMDSEARIVGCLRAALQDIDLPDQPDEQLKNVIGLGLKEALQRLHPEGNDREHQQLTDHYRYHFLESSKIPSPMFDGAQTLLEELNRLGFFLAVATGKGRPGLDKVLSESNTGHLFHYTRCADETRSKPHPQMLEEIMDFCGVESHETIMIGDTEYDLQMANHAGAHALAVSYGVHDKQRLLDCAPLDCVDNINELSEWLLNKAQHVA
ncbi:MAG: HAD-IA family hydrolase [Thioalkalispiraceae bacterium]|jgi:phosphoglycolate phosphatase